MKKSRISSLFAVAMSLMLVFAAVPVDAEGVTGGTGAGTTRGMNTNVGDVNDFNFDRTNDFGTNNNNGTGNFGTNGWNNNNNGFGTTGVNDNNRFRTTAADNDADWGWLGLLGLLGLVGMAGRNRNPDPTR